METSLQKLVSLASSPLGPSTQSDSALSESQSGTELASVLKRVNGFYAFESALHVFAGSGPCLGRELRDWNQDSLWTHAYSGMADNLLFFAEDAFGGQFGMRGNDIYSFDPETAEVTRIASSLEDWASAILNDFEFMTGYPVAREWQQSNGSLAVGDRLVPKTPFVLGGEFVATNVLALDAVRGMNLRGELATQIRDLPNGATVRYIITE